MKNLLRRVTVYCLTLSMAAAMNIGATAAAATTVASGSCGNSATWTLDSEGLLTISGSGNVDSAGWSSQESAIRSLVIEEGITSIPYEAFYGSSATQAYANLAGSLVFPESLVSVGDYAFKSRERLTGALVLPPNISSVGQYAFENCKGLTGDLVIPSGLAVIDCCTFAGCDGLDGNLIISEGVTSIGQWAFSNDRNLTGQLMLPESLQSIGYGAFQNCAKLSGPVSIPKSVTSISDSAFTGCSNLKTFFIYNKNCTIGTASNTFSSEKVTIYGIKGSTAQSYAENNANVTFIPLDQTNCSHPYTENLQEIESDCKAPGLSAGKSCSICGVIVSGRTELPLAAHKWVSDYIIDKEATCAETGSKAIHCEVCGTIDDATVTEIPKTGHKYGAYVTTAKAAFGKAGAKTSICTGCKGEVTKTIPAVKTPILSAAAYTFNNKAKTPAVTVKDSSGKAVSCSASYSSGRKNVGKYAVKVTLKGINYSGTQTVYFNINPKGVSVSKLSRGKKSFKVKWKKPSATYRKQTTGYQVRYSTSSKMTKAKMTTIKSAKATSKSIKKLKAKKKYYVQIRTYKTVKGKNYYSSWSKVKSVKTK